MLRITLILLLFPILSIGQITTAGWGKPDDLTELSKRQLIVELLDASSALADAKASDLGPFVRAYNEGIKKAIEEQFSWNKDQEVLFLPTTEMKALISSKSPETYATFRFHIEGDHMGYVSGTPGSASYQNLGKSDYTFFQFLYSGPDRDPKKQDFTGFLPAIYPGEQGFRAFDLQVAVKLIQDMMSEYVDTGKKTYTRKYLKGLSKTVCGASNEYELVLDEAQLHEDLNGTVSSSSITAHVRKDPLDTEKIKKLSSPSAVLVSLPFDVLDASGYAAKLYSKLIVDPQTLKVLAESGVSQVTKPFTSTLNEKDLKTLEKCQ